MKPVVRIFHINSNDKFIDASSIDNYRINDFGNGFFISKDGLLASVAHVFECEIGFKPYAFLNDKFYKIDVLSKKHTAKDENHIDAAIGKIEFDNVYFFDPEKFERVREKSKLLLAGFSRNIPLDKSPQTFSLLKPHYFYKIDVLCFDTKHGCSFNSKHNNIVMKHSFTITIKSIFESFGGFSGSPVIYKKDNVVGIFKGGPKARNFILGNVIHIDTIKDMYLNLL